MQFQQPESQQNMNTGAVPSSLNHGGHEMFDVHEILAAAINTINIYTIVKDHIQDSELLTICERQLQFMSDEYNITLDCFKTGKDPMKHTEAYMMQQNHDFIYGTKPSTQPQKPVQSTTELNDQNISQMMLNAIKASGGLKAQAAMEVTNPVVRRVIADSVPNCIELAYEISLYQNKHGYYQVPQLPQQDMINMLNGYGATAIINQNNSNSFNQGPPTH
ncbi:putative pore coat protein [Bacillus sp. TS-2]|nr:putative pore coat protein [Bacillus sp. TS-2]